MPQPITASDDAPEPLTDTGNSSLDAKLAALDDNLEPIDPGNDPYKQPAKADTKKLESHEEDENDEQANDEEDDTEEADDENAQKETEEGKKTEKPKDKDDNEEGYILDEEDKLASEGIEKEGAASVLEPQEQFILNGIKDSAITVRGVVGDSTEVREYKVLMPEQLPPGFKYIDDREQSIANKSYNLIEQEARRLQTEYIQKKSNQSGSDFVKRENLTERQDAASLQKRGDIPAFKKNPEMPYGFDSSNYRNVINLLAENKDEAAVLIKDVLDFKDKTNDRYMKEYQAGRSYKHLGFDEAFQMYRKDNGTKSNPAQVKEDTERHEVAKRTGGTKGTTTQPARPRIKQGMTSRELDDYIESIDL